MRKLCFVLTALLLTVPAVATIDVNCQPTANPFEVEVTYDATSDGNMPRAFGLDIRLDNAETITALVSDSNDFWVHPGRIVITDGNITDDANALAVVGSEGALGGLDTNGITVEMGSLYHEDDANHPNQPPSSGVLLTFTVSGSCHVTISGNAARGNVVLESTAEASVSYGGCDVGPTECFPSELTAEYAEWSARGKPSCWCNPRQCHGDAAGNKEGSTRKGYWYVGSTDLNVMVPAWKVKEPPDGSGILGKTSGSILLTCADFAHNKEGSTRKGYWYVGSTDLNAMVPYWKVKEPPDDSGTPADCLDVP